MAKGKQKKKREKKLEVKSRRVMGKDVAVFADGDFEGAVVKLQTVRKPRKTAYLETGRFGVEEGIQFHRSEKSATRRLGRRFPKIMPTLRKRL